MSEARTITVAGYFGDKEITKEEFADIWYKHLLELRRLDYSSEWNQKVDKMADEVRTKCHEEFERMFEVQNKDKA